MIETHSAARRTKPSMYSCGIAEESKIWMTTSSVIAPRWESETGSLLHIAVAWRRTGCSLSPFRQHGKLPRRCRGRSVIFATVKWPEGGSSEPRSRCASRRRGSECWRDPRARMARRRREQIARHTTALVHGRENCEVDRKLIRFRGTAKGLKESKEVNG